MVSKCVRLKTVPRLLIHTIFLQLACLLAINEGRPSDEKLVELYSPSDPVLIVFGQDQFTQVLSGKNNSFLVEFFASWCGHCQEFAPLFREFAKDVARWNSTVQIAVVDCNAESNIKVCEEQEIDSYPKLKYFNYGSTSSNDSQFYVGKKDTAENISIGLARMVRDEYMERKHTNWPHLVYANNRFTIAELWHSLPPSVQYMAVIIDVVNSTDLVAVRTALDFSGQQDKVAIKIVSNESSTAEAYSLTNPAQLPGLLIFKRSSSHARYVSQTAMKREEMVERIIKQAQLKSLESELFTTESSLLDPKSATEKFEPNSKLKPLYFVHKLDLLSSLRFIFYREVTKYRTMRGPKLRTLREFLEILLQYFPSTDNERRFLLDLTSWFNSFKTQMTSDIWLQRLEHLQKTFGNPLPEPDRWAVCNGSLPRFRGFPCSLWTLFHTITVRYYMENHAKPFAPTELMVNIRDFVLEIFGCAACATNFQKEMHNVDSATETPRDTVLHLWRVHNNVNARLKGSTSEDPLYPKEQFPMPFLCPSCYNSDQSFNEDAVFNFLVNYYGKDIKDYGVPGGVQDAGAPSDKAGKDREADRIKNGSSAGGSPSMFNRLDFSLCLGLWFLTSFLLGFR